MPSIKDLTSDEDKRRRILLGEGAPKTQDNGDISWALNHLLGYGQVGAPGAFGHDRDKFASDHPNYAGGYYNPKTGGYDGPDEPPPWVQAEPQRPGGANPTEPPPWMSHGDSMGGLPGGQAPAEPVVPSWMSHEDSMGNLPRGGNVEPLSHEAGMANLPSGGDTSTPQDYGVVSPESSQSMPGAGEPSMGQLMEMISNYMEQASTSNGT